MLDKIPAWARHLLIIIGAGLLTVISQSLADKTFDVKSALYGLAGVVVAQLLLVITPLTQQYGVGSPPPPGEPVITGDETPTP